MTLPRSGRSSKIEEKTRKLLKGPAEGPTAAGKELQEILLRVEAQGQSSASSPTSSPSPSSSERPAAPPTPSSAPTPPRPEVAAMEREVAASKGLMEWLRLKPGYSLDLPFAHVGAGVLHGLVERPKQRRHRCKDPSKLDVNSLTGEERVPVVHRGTGRRLGGAMAPAIKELSRWLDANSEYFVAPDWADVVKHSGFLPEGKFSRILTEPVNRDPSSRRRGRRPRSEMPKPLLADVSGPPPPIFMNGALMGGVDSVVAMQNLRGGIPGIPISGIMAAGFPHVFPAGVGGASAQDAKNGLSMLPMMLHGMPPPPHGPAVPQHALFSVGAVMPLHTASSSSSAPPSPAAKVAAGDEASEEAPAEAPALSGSQKKGEPHAGGHLTFNPFLIPGMSHGLLYPHMFLPHGGIMALPAVPPADGAPGSPKRKRRRERDESDRAPECQESDSRRKEPESETECRRDPEPCEEPPEFGEPEPGDERSQNMADPDVSAPLPAASQEADCHAGAAALPRDPQSAGPQGEERDL